jgi:hypothetical protein
VFNTPVVLWWVCFKDFRDFSAVIWSWGLKPPIQNRFVSDLVSIRPNPPPPLPEFDIFWWLMGFKPVSSQLGLCGSNQLKPAELDTAEFRSADLSPLI